MAKNIFLLLFLGLGLSILAQTTEKKIKIIQTSDIHGNYFPYDFIEEKPAKGSLSRVSTYLKQERSKYGTQLLMLDNGDILQGQPSAYYYNFVDTITRHLCPRILDFMSYNAITAGNHDIETGNAVYNRLIKQSNFPWLAANAVLDHGDGTYFTPYTLFDIEGVRIAVIGMITPAIPTWLPKKLWKNMHFEDIQTTAKKWIPYLKNEEKAEIIIGLLHLGTDSRIVAEGIDEGGGYNLAHDIPGFDVVMLGHDHRTFYKKIANVNGDSVVIINPGAHGHFVSDVEISLTINKGNIITKKTEGKLVNMKDYEPDTAFLKTFQSDFQAVKTFVSKKLGYCEETLSSRDAYFGPSAFVDLIHRIQLDLTKADVSFAAPLSFDTKIEKGDILVSDMFKLYQYENFLYTMKLTGKEIKDFLESSYTGWVNQMLTSDDHLLLLQKDAKSEKYRFVNASYNFDSASGISYTVDVTKPTGEKIVIAPKMANGKNFLLNNEYLVAINSYRGNGGGGHLTNGAGIPLQELPSRIINSTDLDFRYYMMQYIEKRQHIKSEITSDWKMTPEAWVKTAAAKDYLLLFPN